MRPPVKVHCPLLAEQAISAAIEEYQAQMTDEE